MYYTGDVCFLGCSSSLEWNHASNHLRDCYHVRADRSIDVYSTYHGKRPFNHIALKHDLLTHQKDCSRSHQSRQ